MLRATKTSNSANLCSKTKPFRAFPLKIKPDSAVIGRTAILALISLDNETSLLFK